MARFGSFALSRHARRRLRQRQIGVNQIRRALEHPDRTEPDADDPSLRHALKRIYHRGGSKMLRVIYNWMSNPPRVVTAFFDRRAR